MPEELACDCGNMELIRQVSGFFYLPDFKEQIELEVVNPGYKNGFVKYICAGCGNQVWPEKDI